MHPHVERIIEAYDGGQSLLPSWLDFSGFNNYLQCPRSWFLSNILGLIPGSGPPNIHLLFGKALHNGLEESYAEAQDLQEREVIDGYEESELHTVLAEIGKAGFDESWFKNEGDLFEKPPKTRAKAHSAIDTYWAHHVHALMHHTDVVAVERSFGIPLGAYHPVLYGSIDLLVRGPTGLQVLEHKTTQSFSQAFKEGWETSWQLSAYILASYMIYGEIPVAIVNGILFQKTKAPDLISLRVPKTPDDLEQFTREIRVRLEELEWHVRLLVQDAKDNAPMSAFPKNPYACQGYRLCPFYDFCTSWRRPYLKEKAPAGWRWESTGEGLFVEHQKT